MDYSKYKASLKSYLRSKGFNTSNNPMMCFSPSHNNTGTPACMIYEEHFKCASCGIEGDVYDACEILTGIKDKVEQYKEVEKTLGGYTPEPEKQKKENFQIDPESFKKLTEYLKNYGGRQKGVLHFLKERGYIDEIANKMSAYFVYWPGFDTVYNELGKEILKNSGIPLVHPLKQISSWNNPGAIVRLAKGLKLNYYRTDGEKKICEKRGSNGCYTFPGPWQIKDGAKIILVEAEITAIAMRAIGYENTFPAGGTNGITLKSLESELLKTGEITFAFDGDNPGRWSTGIIKQDKDDEKKKRVYPDELRKREYKGIIKIAHLPDDKDPDDLIREGRLSELKKIINDATIINPPEIKKKIQKTDLPFFFLGYDDKAYYVLPKSQTIPIRVARGDKSITNWFQEIANPEFWLNMFSKTDDDGIKTFDRWSAMTWFREESIRRGIFNDKKILGIGAHKDNNEFVFNLGDSLFYNNKKIEYDDYEGENNYCKSKIIIKFEGEPWGIPEGLNLVNQLKTFSFERSIDFVAVCGYMAMAPFASILDVRPHVWITAKKGTGKTTLLKRIIKPCVGEDQALYTEGITSEAYIRQTCGKDCRVPIIDEFESHSIEQAQAQKKILTLIRTAYTGTETGKGSPEQKPIDFNLKLMFCLLSINVKFDNEADRSRVAICRLKEKKDKKYAESIKNGVGLRLRMFSKVNQIQSNILKAKEVLINNGCDNRTADTYAALITGFWMMISDKPFFEGDEKIQEYILKSVKTIGEEDYKDDEERIMDRILTERIRISPTSERTISEMLIETHQDIQTGDEIQSHDSIIRRYGLRRCKIAGVEILAIDTDHQEIKKILKDTAFTEYKEILQRHPDVIERSKVVYMAGKNTRCIIFSWEKLYNRYFNTGEIVQEDIPF